MQRIHVRGAMNDEEKRSIAHVLIWTDHSRKKSKFKLVIGTLPPSTLRKMPRENRKRGKKNKKKQEDEYPVAPTVSVPEPEPERATPSWITSAAPISEEVNAEAPFGYVDVDVKAYFRTVDTQIRDWQDNAPDPGDADQDIDPNEGMSWSISQFPIIKRFPYRKTHVLRRCSYRDDGEGKTARHRPRLFVYSRKNDLFNG